jgi:ArsR family transcriptional regulator, arsenate/arsenite/antimonite-responsive transcriptional repressor
MSVYILPSISIFVNMLNMKTNLFDCCPPLLLKHLQPDEAERLAVMFRVLGEASRLQLLSLIASQSTGAACVCELIEPLGLSQPTVSHHLKVLHDAGFLTKERRGTWIYYRVVPETLQAICGSLQLPGSASTAP